MRLTAILPLFVLALPLGGCETLGLTSPSPDLALVDMGPICPASAVLSDAVVVTKLRPGTPPGQPNAANVAFTAEMSQAKLDCNFNREKNTLSVDINFAVKAARGPAGMGAEPQLDFFVAVVDADNNIISKTVYHGQPDLRGKQANVYTQKVDNFPVVMAMDKRPYDYEILTGFQLTPDELAYNRVPKSVPTPRAATR
jgi:hypothetical protein